jgi:hypothetical protein
VVVSGSDDQTVRVWDAATGTAISDLPWRYDEAEIPPSKIDLAAWVFGIAYVAPSRLVIATELGIVSLRMPTSSSHSVAIEERRRPLSSLAAVGSESGG